jgi:polysaccharide biosynthesis transport protein
MPLHESHYLPASTSNVVHGVAPHGPPGYGAMPYPPPSPEESGTGRSKVGRIIAAVLRYRWLVLAVTVAATAAGFGLSRTVTPLYDVQSTIWISKDTPEARAAGPIRADGLLVGSAWTELLRSFAILDEVVLSTKLYLEPMNTADASLLATLEVAPEFRPGRYMLRIDEDGRRQTLLDAAGEPIEVASVGDSIGRAVGFRWVPVARELRPRREASFVVMTPREASLRLRSRLGVSLPPETNLMRVTLSGTNPQRLASTLNALTARFVEAAATLKKRNLVEFRRTLEVQLAYAEGELREAEGALENFRVSTITLPSEGGPVTPGLQDTRDPVFDAFFRERIAYDQLKQDRAALERALAGLRTGTLDPNALWTVSALQTPNEAPELRAALGELSTQEAALRTARVTYTDQHPLVQERLRAIQQLRRETIPQLAGSLLARWQQRERDMEGRLATASTELRAIPSRTIEEMRLRRNVDVRQNLYTTLKNRFEEARLAEVSAVPDVSVLDPAVAPSGPGGNTGPRLIAMALLAGLALGVAIAILLDRLDRRLHYVDQVTDDLRLGIVGAVPRASRRPLRASVEEAAALVESFRSIRVNVQYALPAGAPIRVAVSSPGAGDGKSFVSANLALSFAEAGYRTLLLDADTRRGGLHATFGTDRLPGLVDYLGGAASLEEIMRPTSQERLTLIPCGTRTKQSPELLASPRLAELITDLHRRHDVIVIDCPPLGAGVDAFVLGIAAQHLIMVLRSGKTDRKLARAKLELLDRLPVAVVGAVLNDVPTGGQYRYYAYLPGYAAEDERESLLLGPDNRLEVAAVP